MGTKSLEKVLPKHLSLSGQLQILKLDPKSVKGVTKQVDWGFKYILFVLKQP